MCKPWILALYRNLVCRDNPSLIWLIYGISKQPIRLRQLAEAAGRHAKYLPS